MSLHPLYLCVSSAVPTLRWRSGEVVVGVRSQSAQPDMLRILVTHTCPSHTMILSACTYGACYAPRILMFICLGGGGGPLSSLPMCYGKPRCQLLHGLGCHTNFPALYDLCEHLPISVDWSDSDWPDSDREIRSQMVRLRFPPR